MSLLVSSVLLLTMTTTLVVNTYLPSFVVDIPDIQEPTQKLTPTTMKQKLESMQIKDPGIINRYKDPTSRHRYQMLRAIYRRKRAAHTTNLKTKTDLLQYQDTVPIPNTYTITYSDVFCDTPNLQRWLYWLYTRILCIL